MTLHAARTSARARFALLASGMLFGCSDPLGCVDTGCPTSVPSELRAPDSAPHQEEPSLAVLPSGRVVVAWKEMPEPAAVGRLGLARSDDGGTTWTTDGFARSSDGPGHSDPWLAARASGDLVSARYSSCQVSVSRSDDGGATWGAWRDMHSGDDCADKPSLSPNRTGPMLLAYHVLEDGGYARIDLAESTDDGRTWSPPLTAAPAGSTVRLAPSAAVLPDGSFLVAWWRPDLGTIEASRSNDRGSTWSSPSRLNSAEGSVPREGRPELRPPFPSVAVLGSTAIAAWPDFASGRWDVVVARSEDAGRSWSDQRPIGSGVAGDRWMVSLAAGPDGRVHGVWYEAAGGTRLRYAVSQDLGRSWQIVAEEADVVATGRARLGDYLGLDVGADGRAFVAWTAVRNDSLRVFAARAEGLGSAR